MTLQEAIEHAQAAKRNDICSTSGRALAVLVDALCVKTDSPDGRKLGSVNLTKEMKAILKECAPKWNAEPKPPTLAAAPQAPAQADIETPEGLEQSELYRMRMAGISTAALGYWKPVQGIRSDYKTPALMDVAALYAKYAALHEAQAVTDAQIQEMIKQLDDCEVFDENGVTPAAISIVRSMLSAAPAQADPAAIRNDALENVGALPPPAHAEGWQEGYAEGLNDYAVYVENRALKSEVKGQAPVDEDAIRNTALQEAANFLQKLADDYINDHGSYDHETGFVEYPESGREYVSGLVEQAEAIRALQSRPQQVNKMSALRPCLVTTYEWSSEFGKNMQVDTKPALFHEWGLDCTESEEGDTSYSVAIVELDDGRIETHQPYAIRFTDQKGGTQ